MSYNKLIKLLPFVTLISPALAKPQVAQTKFEINVQIALADFSQRSVAEYRNELSKLNESVQVAALQYSEKANGSKLSCRFRAVDFTAGVSDVSVLGQFQCSMEQGGRISRSALVQIFAELSGHDTLLLDIEPFGSATIGN